MESKDSTTGTGDADLERRVGEQHLPFTDVNVFAALLLPGGTYWLVRAGLREVDIDNTPAPTRALAYATALTVWGTAEAVRALIIGATLVHCGSMYSP